MNMELYLRAHAVDLSLAHCKHLVTITDESCTKTQTTSSTTIKCFTLSILVNRHTSKLKMLNVSGLWSGPSWCSTEPSDYEAGAEATRLAVMCVPILMYEAQFCVSAVLDGQI